MLSRLLPFDFSKVLIENRKLLVAAFNLAIVLLSLLISILIRFDMVIPSTYSDGVWVIIGIFVLVKLPSIHIFNLNRGLWRYTSVVDLRNILMGNALASLILLLVFGLFRHQICGSFAISVIIIDFMICVFLMGASRICVRVLREYSDMNTTRVPIRSFVIGKLDDIDKFLHSMTGDSSGRRIIGILSPEKRIGGTIRGVPIMGGTSRIAELAKAKNINEILLIPPYSRKRFLNLIMARFEDINYNCAFRIIPNSSHITNGDFKLSSIREVDINDLLGRPPVKLDHTEVISFVKGKNIMVTGGGGSIGSELCHQLCAYAPKKLVVFEFSEFNLYEIDRELRSKFPEIPIVSVLGDVRYKNTILKAIRDNQIEIVYHAAAYKHVPMLEHNEHMAFHTNVIGTANLAEAAEAGGVKRVIVISTDKAVRPTSVMGSTKHIAERVVLEREKKNTEFTVVRFGNVLGSRGSVVPLFKQQISRGGPVTITSKNMIRYFMSIPEAVELVLQAGAVGNDRDIMILEMGEQVNIYEMAKRLITLSGFRPHCDIKIEFTGIRPGEKEYEELLTREEEVDRTPYNRIFVIKKNGNGHNAPAVDLDRIKVLVEESDTEALRGLCHVYIPENMLGNGNEEMLQTV